MYLWPFGNILLSFGILFGYMVYCAGCLVQILFGYFVYFPPHFGMLYPEKSGNPDVPSMMERSRSKSPFSPTYVCTYSSCSRARHVQIASYLCLPIQEKNNDSDSQTKSI
jgi:hypothetical protein